MSADDGSLIKKTAGQEVRKIFPDPAIDSTDQILLGITDATMAGFLLNAGKTPAQAKELKKVADELAFQEKFFRRASRVGISLEGGPKDGAIVHGNGTMTVLHGNPVSNGGAAVTEEMARNQARAIQLAEARTNALAALRKVNGGFFRSSFRRILRVGGYVFILDEAARVVVWSAFDASPKVFPIKDIAKHYGQEIYTELENQGFIDEAARVAESSKEIYRKRFDKRTHEGSTDFRHWQGEGK